MGKFIKIITTVLVVTSVGFSLYYFYFKSPPSYEVINNIATGTKEYRNTERGFSLHYPVGLTLKEYDEGETTFTLVFSDETGDKSFQIFWTPYFGEQITDTRIKKDVPNGKITEPIEIVISGGIHALAFFSSSSVGEFREVWFIHKGYLYEVTAYKDLDEWLAKIMQTWRFI